MAENIQRTRGRGQGYKFDRGGTPAEFGPYIGVVKNNIDTLRAGRLQVYIEEFSGGNESDSSLWRTVAYVPPFYGIVEQSGTNKGTGNYIGNPQSYGMWFTPPDLGIKVICFFASGDPNQGYYIGCVPELGITHMIPAVGASQQFNLEGSQQQAYLSQASQLPVTEINIDNEAISENPKFYDQPKPVHGFVSAVMLQQGLITDNIRGPITSNSQRESPSTVYGISTPGRSVTQGSINENNVQNKANDGSLKIQDLEVVGRRGGHSIVLDDGNIDGSDNLIRIRTSKGHQITMSDDGDCFYVIHANGQSWLEFGSEGTVDVFSTNSINLRTRGDLNLHADQNINMFAGTGINLRSNQVKLNSDADMEIVSKTILNMSGTAAVGISSMGAVSIGSSIGVWNSLGPLALKGAILDLNGPIPLPVIPSPSLIQEVDLADVKFQTGKGWIVAEGALKTIVSRAPTHEPYPYHNRGVPTQVDLNRTATYRRSSGFGSLALSIAGGLAGSVAGSLVPAGALSGLSGLSASTLASVSSLQSGALSSLSSLTSSTAASLSSLSAGALSSVSGLASSTAASLSSLSAGALSSVSGLATDALGNLPINALSDLSGLPINALSELSDLPINALSELSGLPINALSDLSDLPINALSDLSKLPSSALSELSLLPSETLDSLSALKDLPSSAIAAVASSTAAVEQLVNNIVTSPIDAAQILKQVPALAGIASLTVPDVTSLLASTVASVNQPAAEVSTEKGVGKYGFSPTKLEQLGILKFGTVARYGSDEAVLSQAIDSPGIWTGKFGVRNLQSLLSNESLQDQMQQDLMVINYEQLQRSGTVTGIEPAAQVGALLQSALLVGPESVVDWVKQQASSEITTQINNVSKNAQQAISMISNKIGLSRLGRLAVNIAGVFNTVSRVSVDQSVTQVINNPKVLSPIFRPRERTASSGGNVERIDIASVQREARAQAIAQARARGASEQQADAEGNAAGNLAGADAFRRLN